MTVLPLKLSNVISRPCRVGANKRKAGRMISFYGRYALPGGVCLRARRGPCAAKKAGCLPDADNRKPLLKGTTVGHSTLCLLPKPDSASSPEQQMDKPDTSFDTRRAETAEQDIDGSHLTHVRKA